MGASILQVVTLTTRNYLWLALIAACIAFPVAWFTMSKWLRIFQYNDGLICYSIYFVCPDYCHYSISDGNLSFCQSRYNESGKYFKDGVKICL